jgi:hypothetical protein
MATVLQALPVLQSLKPAANGCIELVNNAAVEEILMTLGQLDFGKAIRAKAGVSLWRTRGDYQQLVGEFSFQIRFKVE